MVKGEGALIMPKLSIYFIRAALLHFGIGFSIAALMLANKGIPFSAEIWRLLEPHVQILIFGWMLQLAMGVAFYALPRLTNTEARYGDERLAWLSFILLNAGVWLSITIFPVFGKTLIVIAGLAFVRLLVPRVKAFGV
jgi:cbb3-type cytochrome oxidase subunit 1